MPWTKKDYPDAFNNLPPKALAQALEVSNERLEAGDSEQTAIKKAFGALKAAGWEKQGDKWVKATKSTDDQEVDRYEMTSEDKSAFETAIQGDTMTGLSATHRRLHMWAEKGNVLSGASESDMVWMHNQVVKELTKRHKKDKTAFDHTSPLKYADGDEVVVVDIDEFADPSDVETFCAAQAVWGKMKSRAKKKKKKAVKKSADTTPVDKFATVRRTYRDWGPVLRAVAVLGADTPEVKTLEDLNADGPLGELRDVELFEAGWHRGKWFGVDWIDRVVRNFDALKDVMKPYLWLGHNEDQEILRASGPAVNYKGDGTPSAGWVQSLVRVGSKLVAPLVTGVPESLRQAIKDKRYLRVSPEIYPKFEFKEEANTVLLDSRPDEGGGTRVDPITVKEGMSPEEIRELVIKQVDQATLKLRDENATLRVEAQKTAGVIDSITKAKDKAEVEKYTDELRTMGVAPAVLDGGLVELLAGLDNKDTMKFTEASDAEEGTQRVLAMGLIRKVMKMAADGKLLVPKDERGKVPDHQKPTDKFTDQDRDKLASEMAAGTDRGKKGDKDQPSGYAT